MGGLNICLTYETKDGTTPEECRKLVHDLADILRENGAWVWQTRGNNNFPNKSYEITIYSSPPIIARPRFFRRHRGDDSEESYGPERAYKQIQERIKQFEVKHGEAKHCHIWNG